MNNYKARLILFTVLNFSALGISYLFSGEGPESAWYMELSKVSWMPTASATGFVWVLTMVCFSFFMANMTEGMMGFQPDRLTSLYVIQWILLVLWNYVFFRNQDMSDALFIAFFLFLTVAYLAYLGFKRRSHYGILMLPYVLWLIVLIWLNAYVLS